MNVPVLPTPSLRGSTGKREGCGNERIWFLSTVVTFVQTFLVACKPCAHTIVRHIVVIFLRLTFLLEPPIKDTPNKGHRSTNLSIKDKIPGPNVSIIRRFHLYNDDCATINTLINNVKREKSRADLQMMVVCLVGWLL